MSPVWGCQPHYQRVCSMSQPQRILYRDPRDNQLKPLPLGPELGRGGEGNVYAVATQNQVVAKIYHAHRLTSVSEQKIAAMVANPPNDPAKPKRSIAWPLALLYTGQHQFAGFIMPRVDQSMGIFNAYSPTQRKQNFPDFTWQSMHRMATNLAIAVHSVHAKQYVIGDVNQNNFLVDKQALVTVIDTDSFQVKDAQGQWHVCQVGVPDYTPPELQGLKLATIRREPVHDRFGLGVLLFQLLMNGIHPFMGTPQLSMPSVGQVFLHCIKQGIFPYKSNQSFAPPPHALPFDILDRRLQHLFIRTFVEGHHAPNKRADALEWAKALRQAEDALVQCAQDANHWYVPHSPQCPWCEQNAQQLAAQFLVQRPLPVPSTSTPMSIPTNQPLPSAPTTIPSGQASQTYYGSPPVSAFASTAIPQAGQRHSSRVVPPPVSSTPAPASSASSTSKRWPRWIVMAVVVYGLFSCTMWLWNGRSNELAVLGHGDEVYSAVFSPDGQRILTASRGGTAQLWNLGGSRLHLLHRHRGFVRLAVFNPDGQMIVTASESTVHLWDGMGNELAVLRGHTDWVYSAAFSSDGQRIVTASGDGRARLWDGAGNELTVLRGHGGWVWSAVFSPDGQRIVTASGDGTARLWDGAGNELAVLRGHKREVNSAVFSPDGQRIVTASADGTVRLWDGMGNELAVLRGHERGVNSAVFSPDGQRIVTASADGTARLWDRAGNELAVLRGHELEANSAVFSPDGQRIVTASVDGTARLWDGMGNELAVLRGHRGEVNSAVFSPDGQRIVTASADGTARLWDATGN